MSQRKRLTGTVKWFSGQRRYGFVAPDIGGEDLFVHYNSIRSEGSRMLTQGDVVEFSVEKGENGRMKAVNVTGPAGTEIPVGESSGGGGFSGWSKGGGDGREEFGRGGGRSWGRNGRAVDPKIGFQRGKDTPLGDSPYPFGIPNLDQFITQSGKSNLPLKGRVLFSIWVSNHEESKELEEEKTEKLKT
ncbi:hypothetical protein IEQ34_001298 [Dendrobium chrysotoxum]|uniref:CSD domain-containing protein n=1 Tax=Dendrobium chrysotoxum TaxID=161865 RepID=A0AAV7H6G7_DENCH|nr:hypothetical protein IEQ34_001298 [Dendrobium chrysotoxum]